MNEFTNLVSHQGMLYVLREDGVLIRIDIDHTTGRVTFSIIAHLPRIVDDR